MTTSSTAAPLPCPPWCDRKHIPGWTVHHVDVGQVTAPGQVITVDVHRWHDKAPTVIALNITDTGIDLTPAEANILAALLVDAVQLAGNGEPEVTR